MFPLSLFVIICNSVFRWNPTCIDNIRNLHCVRYSDCIMRLKLRLRRRMETLKDASFEKEIIHPEAQMSDTEAASSTSGSIVNVLDDAPPLIRTDSVYLTKAMHGYNTDDSITSIDNSVDGYVPGSSEEGNVYEENLTGEMSVIWAKQPMTKGALGERRGSHGFRWIGCSMSATTFKTLAGNHF
uniref:uncharacterized protein LOC124018775 isoform X2 n=1 Tax=Oncorhynchus gorbuscha TaxID=8017 RepID=UPI001EAF3093|nr:uncharacterized protein LOC124018775 isoform X2 [Oncorhynchus gorbuscha]